MRKLDREEVIGLIRRIREKDRNGIDEDGHEEIDILREGIPCPHVSDIIYYPDKFVPGANDLTDEEIADIAMDYKPFAL